METFRDILVAYGVDYDNTMNRMMNSEELYIQLLDMFLADESISRLESNLQQGNLKEAFEAAHTLKGMSGNMGMTPLYEAVCAIVEPLRREEADKDYEKLYADVVREYKKAADMREKCLTTQKD